MQSEDDIHSRPLQHMPNTVSTLRTVLMISLEFSDPIFSGNGVYARAIARSLVATNFQLLILSGVPTLPTDSPRCTMFEGVPIHAVPCDVWKRLDRYSSWEQFGRDSIQHSTVVEAFNPDVVIGVDWTSVAVFHTLKQAGSLSSSVPFVYMNFRIAMNSTGITDDDREFYRIKETEAMNSAAVRVALCQMDAELLLDIFPNASPLRVLSPPLREDLRVQALAAQQEAPMTRRYLTCCSRISPEKNTHKFVELCIALKDFLAEQGLIPYLVGSKVPGDYSDSVLATLHREIPEAIVKDFMSPDDLSKVFQQTELLVLPSLYDSWGMVVTEAAAFGTPTLLHKDSIGAADLLKPPLLSLSTDFAAEDINTAATTTKDALADKGRLREIGERAQKASVAWNEGAFAQQLSSIVIDAQRT